MRCGVELLSEPSLEGGKRVHSSFSHVPHARYACAHARWAHTYGQAIEIVLLSISSLLLSTPAIPLHTVEEVYTEREKQNKRDRATERGEQEREKERERERRRATKRAR